MMRNLLLVAMVIAVGVSSTVGQISSVKIVPPPRSTLHISEELTASFRYRIRRFVATDEYWAQLMFERENARHTISAPRPAGYAQLHEREGSVELRVTSADLAILRLTNPIRAWLYINHRTTPGHSEPILMEGPFIFKLEEAAPPN